MKISHCSPSSINLYKNCQFAYYLKYIIGLESKAGKAALQGTIVHKALQIIAYLSTRGNINIDPFAILEWAWDKCHKANPHIEIRKHTTKKDKMTGLPQESADFKKCKKDLQTVLDDPFYNPQHMKIIGIEKWFKMELSGEEWDRFAIRGFMDLAREIDEDTIEIIDWKTGSRTDIISGKVMSSETLTSAVQARLYYLAAYHIFPKYKNILLTFYYTSDGGPITIALSPSEIPFIIGSVFNFMCTVKHSTILKRSKNWTCKMCSYYKNDICEKIWSDLHMHGSKYIEQMYKKDTR